ncbi:Polysaccharide lyase family 4 protein [Pyrenophora tritici-repentis]|nr:Polysaccharide lyase family 4 protein [Pyrenophora tritici-repentis]
MRRLALTTTTALLLLLESTSAFLQASQNATSLTLSNDRLVASVSKSRGYISVLTLDGQNLLGSESGDNTGIGPYLDCYCTPAGFWTPGRGKNVQYQLFNGTDSTSTPYGGISMGETYAPTGQRLEQYWFLREGETGLHTFSRLVYDNKTTPFLRNLQEFRTLFRPNHDPPLFTHFVANEQFAAPRPDTTGQVVVQDATWKLANDQDAYVKGVGEYFTKYTFQDTWRNHRAHGMWADGSGSKNGTTYGAWLVHNTVETYFNGPVHSDLVVDGIVYNYMVSNHHGDQTPNITDGFDRTFGPQYFHFNAGGSLEELRDDASQYGLQPDWNAAFYDSIAHHVPNLVPTSQRGTFNATIRLPSGAENAIAILTASGHDFQDNVFDPTAYQYWTEIPLVTNTTSQHITIPRVKAGSYRLTIYATSIFGDYTHDNITITPGATTSLSNLTWAPDSAGKELFRIGTPDKSSGEYLHGTTASPTHPLLTEEYRLYWAAYDYITDFPNGVTYRVGHDDVSTALNYVHWAVYGGKANSERPVSVPEHQYNWTILFEVSEEEVRGKDTATFTVQLAGAKTAAGNTDVFNATERWADLPLGVAVNGVDLVPWVIPHYQSSSCAVRSAVICYNLAHKFTFDASILKSGEENSIILSLPYNGTNYESALLPESVYVQYDAMRLEVE